MWHARFRVHDTAMPCVGGACIAQVPCERSEEMGRLRASRKNDDGETTRGGECGIAQLLSLLVVGRFGGGED